MNRMFDYNGSIVSPSKAVRTLRTVKKTLMIDSNDRDLYKFTTNGDFVVYLPRVYENVLAIRLMAAEFPPLANALVHSYAVGTSYASDTKVTASAGITPLYFLLDIEGLNKTDEASVGANRSTFPDSYFAKITAIQTTNAIEYNDHSAQENIARYTPALGKLDRLRIRTRLHGQQGNQGFIYWTSDGSVPDGTKEKTVSAQFSLSFELEFLDNTFDSFSSFETRVSERGEGGFGSL